MKRLYSIVLALAILAACLLLPACSPKKKTIVIYSTSEDFRIENAQKMLDEKFPEYKIVLEYKGTGDLSVKLDNEGANTDCDIIMELENGYLEKLGDKLAVLDGVEGVDFDAYLPELVPASHRYVPIARTSCAFAINTARLTELGLDIPTSYEDLLDAQYRGQLSLPNPKSSGTAYCFYLNMVNYFTEKEGGDEAKGLAATLDYFDALSANLAGGFTSSGSGPIQKMQLGEASIGLCMTWQAVDAINKGATYEIEYFGEAAYNNYSSAIVAGRETDPDIQKVFSYLVTDVTPKDKELFAPETIYKNKTFEIAHFPASIPYASMTGLGDLNKKEELLDAWKY